MIVDGQKFSLPYSVLLELEGSFRSTPTAIITGQATEEDIKKMNEAIADCDVSTFHAFTRFVYLDKFEPAVHLKLTPELEWEELRKKCMLLAKGLKCHKFWKSVRYEMSEFKPSKTGKDTSRRYETEVYEKFASSGMGRSFDLVDRTRNVESKDKSVMVPRKLHVGPFC